MQELPDKLYRVDSIVHLEQIAIEKFDIPAYELMTRAADAVFDVIRTRYSKYKNLLVLCGAGNNAGDGYVVARLAKEQAYNVQVISLIDPEQLTGPALMAYKNWSSIGETTLVLDSSPDDSSIGHPDIIVDALLGTGLKRQLSQQWCDWLQAVNRSTAPVISVDVPSGLFADTGSIAGEAVHADVTVCFIGLKPGMFTAQANDYCGEVIYSDLDLPEELFIKVKPDARLLNGFDKSSLPARSPSSHKGCFGHVLIVGGNTGMPGAVILAARAALRTGAGLVTIITISQHLSAISNAVPEAMVKICADSDHQNHADIPSIDSLFTQPFIQDVTHVAVGMGLGRDDWSISVLKHCLDLKVSTLIDADALNLLSEHSDLISGISAVTLVVTPHPGEAARLLSTKYNAIEDTLSTVDIQADRFTAIRKIHELFHHENLAVVLKGSGTLIFDGHEISLCRLGNAAMSAPGMGDVLSGIIIALLAQSCAIHQAVESGVCLHAQAARHVSGELTRGLLASDVIDALPMALS